jgi:flagellar biogenesis protein FliO
MPIKTNAKAGAWLTMAAVSILAVMAGIYLPQLTSGDMVIEKTRPTTETKNKTKTDYVGPAVPEMPNPQGMLSRLAAGTILVLGLAVASIWIMRRWLVTGQPVGSGNKTMRLMESLPLGNRCSIHLVHLGNREVLVGVDGAGIKTIVPWRKHSRK